MEAGTGLFTQPECEHIAAALGAPISGELVEQIELTAAAYFHERRWESAPSPSDLEKRLKQIEAASRKLATLLELDKTGDYVRLALQGCAIRHAQGAGQLPGVAPEEYKQSIDYRPRDWLQQTQNSVSLLQKFAAAAQGRVGRKKQLNRARHEGDQPLQHLINALGEIWTEHASRELTITHIPDLGTAPSPFLLFVSDFLVLPRGKTDEPDEGSALSLSLDAIRARVRNSPAYKLKAIAEKM